MATIDVPHPFQSREWGWGWNMAGRSIERPRFIGYLRRVEASKDGSKSYKRLAALNRAYGAWFYGDRKIVSVNGVSIGIIDISLVSVIEGAEGPIRLELEG